MVFRNEEVQIKNKELKRRIVEISYKLGLSHLGSNLTAVDIIDEIYKSKKPDEKFVLSAGHAHLAHLVVMEKYGIIKNFYKQIGKHAIPYITDIECLIKDYGIHCDRQAGCDASTGSLGHGIGIAVGMALADRTKNVYCLLSDGECMEGSVYEALRIYKENELWNLNFYINVNGFAAYRRVAVDVFFEQFVELNLRKTDMDHYPEWLQGQAAHYVTLDEARYNELMEVLK